MLLCKIHKHANERVNAKVPSKNILKILFCILYFVSSVYFLKVPCTALHSLHRRTVYVVNEIFHGNVSATFSFRSFRYTPSTVFRNQPRIFSSNLTKHCLQSPGLSILLDVVDTI